MSEKNAFTAASDKLARAVAEGALLAKVQAGLPGKGAGLPIKLAYAGGYRANVALSFEAETRGQALAILESFELVPCLFYRGTFASFVPADTFTGRERESSREVITWVKPVAWKASAYEHNGACPVSAELAAWTDVAGIRCHLNCLSRDAKAATAIPYPGKAESAA